MSSQERKKYFKQFKLWVTTQTPLFVLADSVGVSTRTLQRCFSSYLSSPPRPSKPLRKQQIWLKADATYFSRWGCVIVYKAGKNILYWQYADREHDAVYEAGLRWLEKAGYIILGVTSDWHGSIVRTVQNVLYVPHQRCLIHTQRLCESLLTKNPKTEAGQMLLRIVRELNHVTNTHERDIWIRWFELWIHRYENSTKDRTYAITEEGRHTWWYTHRNLRRVYRTLKNTQDHLFLYLNHKGLDKDTNGLEVEFKHLKGKVGSHTGMRKKERVSYISWYLFFKNQ